MRFKEILARIKGLSTPVGGVSWEPGKLEMTLAREVVTFLEDRRVLYAPDEMEIPAHCVRSVLGIRQFLTSKIAEAGERSRLGLSLRAMRAACRKFLNTVQRGGRDIIRFGFEEGHYASWVFLGALGELRGVFGIYIASIAALHRLDVERPLAAILPAADVEGERGRERRPRPR